MKISNLLINIGLMLTIVEIPLLIVAMKMINEINWNFPMAYFIFAVHLIAVSAAITKLISSKE